jgi:hypothetical protein
MRPRGGLVDLHRKRWGHWNNHAISSHSSIHDNECHHLALDSQSLATGNLAVERYIPYLAAPDRRPSRLQLLDEPSTAKRLLDQLGRPAGFDELASALLVHVKDRVDAVRWYKITKFQPGFRVATACSLDTGLDVLSCHPSKHDRVATQHPVQAVVRGHEIEQPRHGGCFEPFGARWVYLAGPPRRCVPAHGPIRTYVLLGLSLVRPWPTRQSPCSPSNFGRPQLGGFRR